MSALDTYLKLDWYERNPKKRLSADDREARIALKSRAIVQYTQLLSILDEAREAISSDRGGEWLKKHPRIKA